MTTNVQLSLPTVLILMAIVGAGAFAAGRAMPPAPPPSTSSGTAAPAMPETVAENEDLPPGHPPIDPNSQAGGQQPGALGGAPAGEPPLAWKAPARWQVAPNTSSMRFATYRVPHAPGDVVDPELSIMQAGGTVEANAERWIGQFDAAGQKTAKRGTRKVGSLDIVVLEVEGTYSGGMGKEPGAGAGWALLGAIAPTSDMPCFFKLTGPAKSVLAAHAEFDALIASLTPRTAESAAQK